MESFAISGGEPFLFPSIVFQTLEFINEYFGNNIYKRIYSNGDFIDESILKILQNYNVNEIRYSIKPYDKVDIALLKLTKKYIKNVVVEMPVIPGTEEYLKEVCADLEKSEISGLNLIELFYSGVNTKDFVRRNLKVYLPQGKIRPIQSYMPKYEYPIIGSKSLATRLIDYIRSKMFKYYVHLCTSDVKFRQFNSKGYRTAIFNKPSISTVTNQNTIRTLAIYDNFDEAINIFKKSKILFKLITDKEKSIQRIETHTDSLSNLFENQFTTLFIDRDQTNRYIVDFKLINLVKSSMVISKSEAIINKFVKQYDISKQY